MAFGFLVYGTRAYGKVERAGDSYVMTTFGHVWWLPVVPKDSFVVAPGAGGPVSVAIGLHGPSILAAYLRTWGVVGLVLCGFVAGQGEREFVLRGVPLWLEAVVLVALVAAGWLLVGRLSSAEAAQRGVYAKFTGIAVDVARFSRAQAGDLREKLDGILASEGRALATTYRDGPDAALAWRDVAVHPSVTHPAYLEAALTRARLELRWSKGDERRALREAHATIWAKLRG